MTQDDIDRESVLMRAYGNNTDILIDRDREATSHLTCAKYGLAPSLLARFNNGLLYRYIPGDVCTPEDLINEEVWRPVARGLGHWHATLPIGAVSTQNGSDTAHANGHAKGIVARRPTPNIWTVMRRWVEALPQDNAKQQARKVFLEQELERSFEDLDNTKGPGESGFVFGHCVSPLALPQPRVATVCPRTYGPHKRSARMPGALLPHVTMVKTHADTPLLGSSECECHQDRQERWKATGSLHRLRIRRDMPSSL